MFCFLFCTLAKRITGVKISWSTINNLVVSIPSKYQSKVCGLCGNYNDNPSDDTLTKKGRVVDTPERFFNSWRVIVTTLLLSLSPIISLHNTFLTFAIATQNVHPSNVYKKESWSI